MSLAEWFLTASERDNPHTRIDDIHAGDQAWSTGNSVRAVVHGRPYYAELHERIGGVGPGDRIYLADWRGDPGERLTDDPASSLAATLCAAAERGADVRGLLWRSHWRHFGYQSEYARFLGEDLQKAGGECLRDMRVRTLGAQHQKFVVIRYAADPGRDIAYVGGIDLCHSRRDGIEHEGDPQVLPMPPAYGPTPAWHDVHLAVQGPAVYDVETVFRERWEDTRPLTLNPGRVLSSLIQREDETPNALGRQAPPPPSPEHATAAVQVLRTCPRIRPMGFDFAPDGELSVASAIVKVLGRAERLVYVEDQYLWSTEVGRHFAAALTANPELRLAVVLPMEPDSEGMGAVVQLYGRSLALDVILAAGQDRVALFALSNRAGLPVYVHAKVCVVDDRWASVGSDNLNRRSWSSDSEISCAVVDERTGPSGPAASDAFPVALRRELVAEHLGVEQDAVPTEPHAIFEAMVAAAAALDAWFDGNGRGERPPGQLRRLARPELSAVQRRLARPLYDLAFDPDGTRGLDRSL